MLMIVFLAVAGIVLVVCGWSLCRAAALADQAEYDAKRREALRGNPLVVVDLDDVRASCEDPAVQRTLADARERLRHSRRIEL